ncbi:MAG: EamA family transporter [Bacilli bacterium]|jgi:drug/metabolite transporter (DMT)-like permease|nr:EamA family transporter [Bacilli bacterium]MCX4254253.1 EamA family transporter [Bacilli bacterium]
MWFLFVVLYIILAVAFTQFYKIVLKTSKSDGTITVLLQFIAGLSALIFVPFFKLTFPTDWKVYLLLGIACIFYAISDRINTTVRSGLEASTFSIIKQLSTVFMILSGLLFFKEQFVLKKIIGAGLIIFSNILIFYKRGKQKLDKYVFLGILSNIAFSIALFLDVNISDNFNLPFYVALTVIVPALFIAIAERIKPSKIKQAFINGNKKAIMITSLCWGTMIIVQLRAYQLGDVTTVAPLCALTVIGNVIVGYIFLKERDNLLKKLLAAVLLLVSVFLIKG